jgi:membrane protein
MPHNDPVNPVDRAVATYQRQVRRMRTRSRMFDRVFLARERYGEQRGGRLAAAISYYGFFAAFSLGLVAYAGLGYLLRGHGGLVGQLTAYLSDNLPWIARAEAGSGGRAAVTVVGSVSLVLTGVGWVEALCSSQRAIWHLDQDPGNVVIRRLVDLGMLFGLGVLVALSVLLSTTIQHLVHRGLGTTSSVVGQALVSWSGPVLELGVNVLLAGALLAAVPRLRMRITRLLPGAVLVALFIQALNSVGRYYIGRSQHNPAYAIVGGAVGLLVYLYLWNQMVMFGAALLATGGPGDVVDLAAGRAAGPDPVDPAAGVGPATAAGDPVAGEGGPARRSEPPGAPERAKRREPP